MVAIILVPQPSDDPDDPLNVNSLESINGSGLGSRSRFHDHPEFEFCLGCAFGRPRGSVLALPTTSDIPFQAISSYIPLQTM